MWRSATSSVFGPLPRFALRARAWRDPTRADSSQVRYGLFGRPPPFLRRGAGRAIAAVSASTAATVYVTGRSVCGQPTTDNLPGAIEESAEEVTRRGGQGIALRCGAS